MAIVNSLGYSVAYACSDGPSAREALLGSVATPKAACANTVTCPLACEAASRWFSSFPAQIRLSRALDAPSSRLVEAVGAVWHANMHGSLHLLP
jgi:hypothetical protein